MFTYMRILITGASGFVGRYVLEKLLEEKDEIFVNKRRKSELFFKKSNEMDNIKIIESEIKDLKVENIHNIDLVIHLASVGVSPQKASIQEFVNTNIKDTISFFLECEKAGVKRFYAIGSCHEYGLSSNDYNFIPADAPLRPISLYASSKVATFLMLFNYAKNSNMEFSYSRLFNVYGYGQNPKNFWSQLNSASKSGKNFEMSKGDQILDFMRVEDVAADIVSKAKKNIGGLKGPLVNNIASGNAITLKDFASSEWSRLGSKGNLIFGAIPERINELKRIVAKLD